MCLLSVDHTDQLMSESAEAASRLLQILGLHFRLPAERSLTQVTIKNIIKVLFHSGSRWTAVQTKHPRCSSLSRWGRDAFHFLLEAIGSLSQARTVKSPVDLDDAADLLSRLKTQQALKMTVTAHKSRTAWHQTDSWSSWEEIKGERRRQTKGGVEASVPRGVSLLSYVISVA